MNRWSFALAALLASLGLGACSTTPAEMPTRPPSCCNYSGIELSLVSDRGGQPSPVKAAEWFATHGGVANIPASQWSKASEDSQGATFFSGKTVLHVMRGTDGMWLVDSGRHCS